MSSPETIRDVTPIEAREMLHAGALLVDVREPSEHAEARVPGSVLVPLGTLSDALATLPPRRTLVVLCRSGNRSRVATEALLAAGYPAVNLRGGIVAWARQGLPVEG